MAQRFQQIAAKSSKLQRDQGELKIIFGKSACDLLHQTNRWAISVNCCKGSDLIWEDQSKNWSDLVHRWNRSSPDQPRRQKICPRQGNSTQLLGWNEKKTPTTLTPPPPYDEHRPTPTTTSSWREDRRGEGLPAKPASSDRANGAARFGANRGTPTLEPNRNPAVFYSLPEWGGGRREGFAILPVSRPVL